MTSNINCIYLIYQFLAPELATDIMFSFNSTQILGLAGSAATAFLYLQQSGYREVDIILT